MVNVLYVAVMYVAMLLCNYAWAAEEESALPARANVRWFGHAYFLITSSDGTRIAIDPYDEKVGYKIPRVEADLVLVTHSHFDHNNVKAVSGDPEVIRTDKKAEIAWNSMTIGTTPVYHDEVEGKKRGKDMIYSFAFDGVNFCHVGDLGTVLTDEQIEHIGPVDVLMMPVGGFYTIDVDKVDEVVTQLKPRIVIPMHYKTEASEKLPIAPVSEYLDDKKNVKELGRNNIDIGTENLPAEREIWVLDWKH